MLCFSSLQTKHDTFDLELDVSSLLHLKSFTSAFVLRALARLGNLSSEFFRFMKSGEVMGFTCYSGFLLHEFRKAFETWIVT